MTAHPASGAPSSKSAPSFHERLYTPWWWYPIALFVAALLAAEFRIGGIPVTSWIPFAVLLPFSCVVVWAFSRQRITVRDGQLIVREAHLPLTAISGAIALDTATLRRVVGREGDPTAFVSIRPFIGPGVQLWLDDPDDPTPYWVLSSRRPDQLVQTVRDSIAARASDA